VDIVSAALPALVRGNPDSLAAAGGQPAQDGDADDKIASDTVDIDRAAELLELRSAGDCWEGGLDNYFLRRDISSRADASSIGFHRDINGLAQVLCLSHSLRDRRIGRVKEKLAQQPKAGAALPHSDGGAHAVLGLAPPAGKGARHRTSLPHTVVETRLRGNDDESSREWRVDTEGCDEGAWESLETFVSLRGVSEPFLEFEINRTGHLPACAHGGRSSAEACRQHYLPTDSLEEVMRTNRASLLKAGKKLLPRGVFNPVATFQDCLPIVRRMGELEDLRKAEGASRRFRHHLRTISHPGMTPREILILTDSLTDNAHRTLSPAPVLGRYGY